MDCPACEEHIGWEWVEEEAIDVQAEPDTASQGTLVDRLNNRGDRLFNPDVGNWR